MRRAGIHCIQIFIALNEAGRGKCERVTHGHFSVWHRAVVALTKKMSMSAFAH